MLYRHVGERASVERPGPRRVNLSLYEAYPGLRLANMLFAHRVQHDHLRYLRAHAAAAVVTSDVAEQLTRAVSGGAVEPSGDELPLLGAFHLSERVPRGLEIAARDAWHWHRAAPREAAPGSRMRVEALALRRR